MCRVTHLIVICNSLYFILSDQSFGKWTSKPPRNDGSQRQEAANLKIYRNCVELTRKTNEPTNALYLERVASKKDKCYRLKIGSGVKFVGLTSTEMLEQGWDIRGLFYAAETGDLHDGLNPLRAYGPPLQTGDDIDIKRSWRNGSLVVEFARDNVYLGKAFEINNKDNVFCSFCNHMLFEIYFSILTLGTGTCRLQSCCRIKGTGSALKTFLARDSHGRRL